MAYNRVVTLNVINNSAQIVQIGTLDFEFNIVRSIDFTNNTAEFIIYNAAFVTRQNILKKGNNIVFSAGYEDEGNIASVFFGTIFTSTSVKQETEWITSIQAIDIGNNNQPLVFEPIALSYIANTLLIQVINDISSILGIPVFGLQNVAAIQLSNGLVHAGTINQLLDKINNILKQNELSLYIDNSQLVIYNIGLKNSIFGVVAISKYNGLVGNVEEIIDENGTDEKKRIRFTSLLNPQIKPNTVISIISENITGAYFVEAVNHRGDTYGGEFFSIVEAAE